MKNSIAFLLGISGIALTSLVPGGPIETRSFAHINPLTLGIFNTILTTLALGSFLLVYFILNDRKWAIVGAAICGLTYIGVYGLDLAYLFPVSPDPMPAALWAIEVFGLAIAIPLTSLSIIQIRSAGTVAPVTPLISSQNATYTTSLILLLGLSIIAFATRSAMGY